MQDRYGLFSVALARGIAGQIAGRPERRSHPKFPKLHQIAGIQLSLVGVQGPAVNRRAEVGVGDNVQRVGETAVDPYPERQSAACCCAVRDHGHDDGGATVESLSLFVQVAAGSVQTGYDPLIHQQAETERAGQISGLDQTGQRLGIGGQGPKFGRRRTAAGAHRRCPGWWSGQLLSGVGVRCSAWRLCCSSEGVAGAIGSGRRPRHSPEDVFSIHGSTVNGWSRICLREGQICALVDNLLVRRQSCGRAGGL